MRAVPRLFLTAALLAPPLAAASLAPEETDRRLLLDASLPRFPLAARAPSEDFELRLLPVDPDRPGLRARLQSGRLQLVEIPGCEALARVFVLPPDPSEGTRRLVVPGALTTSCGSGFPAFVDLVPGAEPAPFPACGLYRAVEVPPSAGGDDGSGGASDASNVPAVGSPELAAATAPDPAIPERAMLLRVRLVERLEDGSDAVRLATTVPFLSDRAFALQSTWAHRDDESPLRSRFFIGGGTLAMGEEGAELAVTASFVREVSAPEGAGALAVRVARQEGWWLARWGETARKTLSAARDGVGELIVELTALPGKPTSAVSLTLP